MIRAIALLTMALDHIGIVYFPEFKALHIIGRLAFPLFAWGIVRGYKHTRNLMYYAARLFLLGIFSQLPYSLLFNTDRPNICFTLLAGLILLRIYEANIFPWIKGAVIIALLTAAQFLNFEYGIYGLLTIFIFYYFGNQYKVFIYQAALTVISTLLFRYEPIQLMAIFSPLIILILESKDLRINKYIQYGFYPAHLFLLLLLR